MIVTCENCQTKFNVPDDKIGAGGRKVRCSSCKHIWVAQPAGIAADEGPAEVKQEFKPKAEPRVVSHNVSDEKEGRKFLSKSFLKVAASLLIIFNFVAFVVFNKSIIGQTAFYDMVGQYDTKAIEITSHDLTINKATKGTDLQIAWVAKNTSTKNMKMPVVRFRIYDEGMERIGEKLNKRESQKIAPGEELKFKDVLIHTNKKARYFTVEIGNSTELATR